MTPESGPSLPAASPASLVLEVEYDGACFSGYQFQPGLETVEGSLRRVLPVVSRAGVTRLVAAGRTDAGVHARGQVVNVAFDRPVDPDRVKAGVNGLLRGSLAVVSARPAPPAFHPRRDATAKHYSYRVLARRAPPVLDRGRVWHVPSPLDEELMAAEARVLVGTHDFSSFRAAGCQAPSPVKTVYSSGWTREGDFLIYRVTGSGFLQHMVRIIVGTLVARGRGGGTLAGVGEILEARSRPAAGPTAPPQGLTMERVDYGPRPGPPWPGPL